MPMIRPGLLTKGTQMLIQNLSIYTATCFYSCICVATEYPSVVVNPHTYLLMQSNIDSPVCLQGINCTCMMSISLVALLVVGDSLPPTLSQTLHRLCLQKINFLFLFHCFSSQCVT